MGRTKKSDNEADARANGQKSRLVEVLQAWMVARVSEELNLPPREIDARESLLVYGLNSIIAFGLTGELADRLNCELPATLFWDWPTLEALANHLADEIIDKQAVESLLADFNHLLSQIEELPEGDLLKSERTRK